jgi:hypothetical protein
MLEIIHRSQQMEQFASGSLFKTYWTCNTEVMFHIHHQKDSHAWVDFPTIRIQAQVYWSDTRFTISIVDGLNMNSKLLQCVFAVLQRNRGIIKSPTTIFIMSASDDINFCSYIAIVWILARSLNILYLHLPNLVLNYEDYLLYNQEK